MQIIAEYTPGISLAEHTTFKCGGVAEYFTAVTDRVQLVSALDSARAHSQPVTILAGGSNVLVSDNGVVGCVIVNKLRGCTYEELGDDVRVTALAGEQLDDLVATTVERGYWGLENLSHIPGSVGATPIQNVGAYGVEVSSLIESVEAISISTGEVRIFSNTECMFSYRESYFKTIDGKDWVVVSVTYLLSKKPLPKITYADLAARFSDVVPTAAMVRAAVIEIRSEKFPDWQVVGTAGSFFKNPTITVAHYEKLQNKYPALPGYYSTDKLSVKVSLGWILDKVCNLRGMHKDNVGCYDKQALVVVRYNEASTTDVVNFANEVIALVKEKTNITIELEVTRIGS